MAKIFGTDGVRGVANVQLTAEMALGLGRAAGVLLAAGNGGRPAVVVGKDTRISGDLLEGALIAGLASVGVDIYRVGVISTPGVAYLVRALGAAAGAMISASHNPIEDNGIKFFDSSGFKLDDSREAQLESLYFAAGDCLPRPDGADVGRVIDREAAAELYLALLRRAGGDLTGLNVVLDCANGSASALAPRMFSDLGARVTVLNNNPNGVNINVGCGSTNPAPLQEAVRELQADLGLAFDGDADRIIAVDEQGEIVDGDGIMAVLAADLLERDTLSHNTLVATVMSNIGLEEAGRRLGFRVVRTAVGDRHVLERMRSEGFCLGGEQSGHIILLDYQTTGDGMLTGAVLASVCRRRQQPLSHLAAILPHYPQVLVNCRVRNKDGWQDNPHISQVMDQVKQELGLRGLILVRPSGTEPLIRVMIQGEDQNKIAACAERLAAVISREMG